MIKKYLFVLVMLMVYTVTYAEVKVLPVSVFTKSNDYNNVKISPDGKHLAITVPIDSKVGLAFVRTRDFKPVGAFNVDDYIQITQFHWASNTRIVYKIAEFEGLEVVPADFGNIYAADIDGGNVLPIFGGYRNRHGWADIIHMLPEDPDHILAGVYSWGSRASPAIAYKINIHKKRPEKLLKAPNKLRYLLANKQGEIKLAYGASDSFVDEVYLKQTQESNWELIDQNYVAPIDISDDGQHYYYFSQQQHTIAGLYKAGFKDHTKKLLYRHPEFDINQVFSYPNSTKPFAVSLASVYPELYFLNPDDAFTKKMVQLLTSFKDQNIQITSYTKDGLKAVVKVSNDKDPGRFYLVNMNNDSIKLLLVSNKSVKPEQMSNMQGISYKARDGQLIYGYLTKPKGLELKKNLPLIVLPHGGPHSRDAWEYNPMVQFLASRGYAVLQMNFRGSEGYGREFLEAGLGQWGGLIQNDIIDGTKWAIKSGIADKNRICIFGSSFGAYSAVMNVVLEPSLYKCAIGSAGIYDLKLWRQFGDIRGYAKGRRYLKNALGEDKQVLKKYSPVQRAEEIQAPVLLIHGGRDRRAPVEQAKALYRQLKKHKNPVELFIKNKEGHGFFNDKNKTEMYEKIEKFIKQHL